VTAAIFLVTIPPVFDERNIWIRLGGGGGHVVMIPLPALYTHFELLAGQL
jgi:hypothetical protein